MNNASTVLAPDAAARPVSTSRRGFLQLTGAVAGSLLLPELVAAANHRERCISLDCRHVGETLRVVYWAPDEGYIAESMAEISQVFRDRRDDSIKPIDPRLIDQLYLIDAALKPRAPLNIISGYRSPRSNAMLRQNHRGVARNSYHMYGRAADMRAPGISTGNLRRAAAMLKAGGVGYYPHSRFIHIDTGPVRSW